LKADMQQTVDRVVQQGQDLIGTKPVVHLLDYAAGNIRSLVNAVEKLGYDVEWIKSPDEVSKAEVCADATASKSWVLMADSSHDDVEAHSARRGPLRPLPKSIYKRRLR
jgi:hypothetical protein